MDRIRYQTVILAGLLHDRDRQPANAMSSVQSS